MGVFRRLFHRDTSLSRTKSQKHFKKESPSEPLDKPPEANVVRKGHRVLHFGSLGGPRRLTDQHGHLRRLWALSTLHIQGQCAIPCDGSLASIYSGSLLEDNGKYIPDNNDPMDRVAKIEPWTETLPSPTQQVPNDSMTDPTSFCSVFEMLSLGPFCGSDDAKEQWDDQDDVTPLPDRTENDALSPGIPKEICFTHQDSSRRDGLPEELSIPKQRSEQRPSLMRVLRNLTSIGRSCPSPYAVQKVNLYVEQPSPFEHTQSIENSTITWPNEHRGNAH